MCLWKNLKKKNEKLSPKLFVSFHAAKKTTEKFSFYKKFGQFDGKLHCDVDDRFWKKKFGSKQSEIFTNQEKSSNLNNVPLFSEATDNNFESLFTELLSILWRYCRGKFRVVWQSRWLSHLSGANPIRSRWSLKSLGEKQKLGQLFFFFYGWRKQKK